jgi:CMP-N,N'-diacetyllegionaminic acid synthase
VKILGFVPARGGSKGIPRKNLSLIQGRTLVEIAVDLALRSEVFDRVVLSTDDEAIAHVGRSSGADVPYLRPHFLADDSAAMVDVIRELLLDCQAKGYVPDAVMVLQPTSPLRRIQHIRLAVSLLSENDSVCSVVKVPPELSPDYLMKMNSDGYLDYYLECGRKVTRRQDVSTAFRRDGTIYLTRTNSVIENSCLYGNQCVPMIIDPGESMSIDTPEDLDQARLMYRLCEPAA